MMHALVESARTVIGRALIHEEDREYIEEAAREWAADVGFDSFEEAFTRERIVSCGNPAGLYELWGLAALELAGRGYVIDWGENRDDARVWSSWTPTDDQEAFERAVLEAWWESWESLGLPCAFDIPPVEASHDDRWDGAHAHLPAEIFRVLSSWVHAEC